MRRYYLGTQRDWREAWRQVFLRGRRRDYEGLERYLARRYQGRATLCKNGRSALALALAACCEPGDGVVVNGFTCYAVVEAVRAAGMVPIYTDIDPETLNFTEETLSRAASKMSDSRTSKMDTEKSGSRASHTPRAIIVQNTLGIGVDIGKIEAFAKKHKMVIIEDLAHCVGGVYPDGREMGTVGAAVALSFGKDKAVDATSGGAVVIRGEHKLKQAPSVHPKISDYLRERWYPVLRGMCRGLSKMHLSGMAMRALLAMRWVERSADNRLDLTRRMPKFEARLALEQMKGLHHQGQLREFALVKNRGEVLAKLRAAGYEFGGFWYEAPVAPERYYQKSRFDEKACPVATEVAKKIINLPPDGSPELAQALAIVGAGAKSDVSRAASGRPVATGGRRSSSPCQAPDSLETSDSCALQTAWKQTLEKFPEANFLQSPEYGLSQELLGCKVITEEFGGRGWAVMVVRDAKRGRYLEIPCGPLVDWGDMGVVRAVFARITEVAKQERCVFVRVRPQLLDMPENLQKLADLGLKKSPMHLAAEHTVMIDLTKSCEDLLAGMRRQTRYEVRRAEKLGISVLHCNTREIFEEFHAVQLETAKRQGFVPPSLEVLLAEHEAFGEKAQIYVASVGEGASSDVSRHASSRPSSGARPRPKGQSSRGSSPHPPLLSRTVSKTPDSHALGTEADLEPIAYGLIIGCGKEADYYEAASTPLNRKLPGAYALLWQAMRDLKEQGYERFNLWGIAPPGQPQHRYAGVTTFKTGFGGEVTTFVPAHDLVISPLRYMKDKIVEVARKKRRHL